MQQQKALGALEQIPTPEEIYASVNKCQGDPQLHKRTNDPLIFKNVWNNAKHQIYATDLAWLCTLFRWDPPASRRPPRTRPPSTLCNSR